jgi:hypothetical protein
MAEKKLTKDDATAMIQAGRRELAAEAQWLRHNMNPKRIASKVAHDHTGALIACGLGIGIVASLLILSAHRKKERHPVAAYRDEIEDRRKSKYDKGAEPKVTLGAHLAGLAFKAATPLLIKNALHFFNAWQASHPRAGSPAGADAAQI